MSGSRLNDVAPVNSIGWKYAPAALILFGLGIALNGAAYPNGETQAKFPASLSNQSLVIDSERSDRVEVLRLLEKTRRIYHGVRDYRCTLITRERLRGQLLPIQVTEMECRVGAFAVHLRWREPSSSAGQEVWFGEGLNNDKMRIRAAGYLGALVGVVSMDPHSPAVRENSRHAITDAGLGTLLEQFAAGWEFEPTDDSSVCLGTSEVNGNGCRTIEVRMASTTRTEWQYGILHIENHSGLPVRVEYYDQERRLLDEATYQDLQLNLGLGDDVFRR